MASYDNFFGVPAVEVLQPSSEAWRTREPFPVLLTCEHASANLPPGMLALIYTIVHLLICSLASTDVLC